MRNVTPSHRDWDRIDTGPQSFRPPMAGDFFVFVRRANSPRILGIGRKPVDPSRKGFPCDTPTNWHMSQLRSSAGC